MAHIPEHINITGKSFEARVAHVWKLKDGKIISFEQFVDSQPVNNAINKVIFLISLLGSI